LSPQQNWSIRHSGLDPESSVFLGCDAAGCPFDFAQGGEPVEPRLGPALNLIGSPAWRAEVKRFFYNDIAFFAEMTIIDFLTYLNSTI
jgi:hypothetical protein